MRDPKRIDEIMELVTKIWKRHPDIRFHQLIHSLQWEYAERKDAYVETLYKKEEKHPFTTYMVHDTVDLFNVEDDDFVVYLREKMDEHF